MIVAAIGWLLAAASAGFFYIAAPNQTWLTRPGPSRRNLILGVTLSIVSLAALLSVMGPATSIYIWLTAQMIVLSAAPFVTLLRRKAQR